jgi:prepilin-type N-terminal cleavage/methylation domain-containing protein/prepilin-type processing-associated H-X9-DG protein
MKRRWPAFTLVELLIVLAVIGILAGMFLPALSAAREQARRKSCANNLAQIGKACISYQEPNGDYFPAFEQAMLSPLSGARNYTTLPPPEQENASGIFFAPQGRDGTFQPMPSLACLYPTYCPEVKIFGCPSTTDRPMIAFRYYNWNDNNALGGAVLHTCFGFDPYFNPTFNADTPTVYDGAYGNVPCNTDPAAYTTLEVSLNPLSSGINKCSYFYDELIQPRDVEADQAAAADADGQAWSLPNGRHPTYAPPPPTGVCEWSLPNVFWQRWPRKPNHDNGQNVMYLDGHVKWSNTNYCSHDPTDNIFSPQYDFSSPQPTPNPDVDAYLWDGACNDARGQSQ